MKSIKTKLKLRLLLKDHKIPVSFRWNAWRRGVGFDIASTAYLNEEEKKHLIKSMETIADSCGVLKLSDEELELFKRIKDYNYHIGYLFRE